MTGFIGGPYDAYLLVRVWDDRDGFLDACIVPFISWYWEPVCPVTIH